MEESPDIIDFKDVPLSRSQGFHLKYISLYITLKTFLILFSTDNIRNTVGKISLEMPRPTS
jgi:hypothetical protein